MPKTRPSALLPNQAVATAPTTTAQKRPLSSATPSSLRSNSRRLPGPTWSRARPRVTSVRVWLPATPPMLATTGISTASATICSIEPPKRPITQAATKALSRFTPSQMARRRALTHTGANMSVSSSRPALASRLCSTSSRITSTMSSMVMRPTRRPSSSTTGAETKLRSWKMRATLRAFMVAGMASMSRCMTLATVRAGSSEAASISDSTPS